MAQPSFKTALSYVSENEELIAGKSKLGIFGIIFNISRFFAKKKKLTMTF